MSLGDTVSVCPAYITISTWAQKNKTQTRDKT